MTDSNFDTANESLGRRVMIGLTKIGLALRSEARAGATERGLSTTQGEILAMLLRKSGMSLSEVAHALAVTRPTASDAVDALVRKGLVEKHRSLRDPRALSLILTLKGQREAKRAATWPDALLGAVETLSAEEQAVWLAGLLKMLKALEERGTIQSAQMCISCRHFRRDAHAQVEGGKRHHCAFIDLPFAEVDLRLDCPDFQVLEATTGP